MPSGVPAMVLGAILTVACSVKENRDICPCRLLLDFSEVDTAVIRSVDIFATAPDGLVFTGKLECKDFAREYEMEIPRSVLNLNIYQGALTHHIRGTELVIPYGEESPMVYAYSSRIDAGYEWVREKIVMKKSHCVMTIRVKDDSDFSFGLEVKGNVNGFDSAGNPMQGDFSCNAPGNAEDGFVVVVPRQVDRSLKLCVNESSGVSRTFALGEYMAASGYDWSQNVLEDVTVWLDYCLTHISITIRKWDGDFSYDVVI